MKIGVLKEIKNNENRVALTPCAVLDLTQLEHLVYIETNAGLDSGFSDSDYSKQGAIITSKKEVLSEASLILKVKEPLPEEYSIFNSNHTLFTYLHLASSKELTEALLRTGGTYIAYETITNQQGQLPLLIPMSQIAGRLSIQEGIRFLLKPNGGSGVLIGGVPGVPPGKVVIIGGGVVGTEAAKMAAGLNANVSILDNNQARLNQLDELLPANVTPLFSSTQNIHDEVLSADLVIGSVLIPGGKAPKLVSEDTVKEMKPGSVIIDVAVDQGGCIKTSEVTTHEKPVIIKHGVLHYGVANMPGAVPRTSTEALVNSTLPYIKKLANFGIEEAIKQDDHLAKGVNIYKNNIVYGKIGSTFNFKTTDLKSII